MTTTNLKPRVQQRAVALVAREYEHARTTAGIARSKEHAAQCLRNKLFFEWSEAEAREFVERWWRGEL